MLWPGPDLPGAGSLLSRAFLLVDFFPRGGCAGFTKRGGGGDARIGPRALETLATPLNSLLVGLGPN